jgi:hypothetical protein
VQTLPECHGCGVPVGELHLPGCDQEDCPSCGMQMLSCPHGQDGAGTPPEDLMPWAGVRALERAASELGWYATLVAGRGWVPCPEAAEDCHPDLNRVCVECVWDRPHKKFVPR